MKSCPMCGTLLFDDAEKCTKCGRALTEGGKAPEASKEPSEDKTTEAAESTAPEADTTAPLEASAKRKKWLEEQEKIRSELASIMGRVGKKRKPLVPTVPTQAAPYPGPVAATPQRPTVQVPKPATPAPTTPVSPVPQVAPSQVQPVTVTQSVNRPVPQGPQQTPGQVGNSAAVAAPQEGLSEINKNELLRELDDLRAEGYNVSKLEQIIEDSPGIAWKAFSDFLDDIEKLNQQKERLEKINTSGFEDFEIEKKQLLSKMIDPELLTNYETKITQFENKFLAVKSEKEVKAALDAEVNKKKSDQVTALIAAGKEAFRLKQYQSAMDIFDQAYALTPDNKEITFFKKKIETKLMEEASAPQAAAGEIGIEEGDIASEAGDKKKKKKKKKKLLFRRSTPEAEEPAAAGTPVSAQAQPEAAPGVAQGQGVGVAPNQPAAVKPVTPQPAVVAQPSAAPQSAEAAGGVGDGPRSAAEFEALGFNAYINKDYPKALDFYEKVLQIDPNFPNVQNIIDECLMRLGKK